MIDQPLKTSDGAAISSDPVKKSSAMAALGYMSRFVTVDQFKYCGGWTIAALAVGYLFSIALFLDGNLNGKHQFLLFFSLVFIFTRWFRAAAIAGMLFSVIILGNVIYGAIYIGDDISHAFGSMHSKDDMKAYSALLSLSVVLPIWYGLVFLGYLGMTSTEFQA